VAKSTSAASSTYPNKHWRDHFDINLFAALRVSRAALPTLIQRGGAIVNVSSIV
jgi:NAD(P)-dependent dehydrogenase (short-subunit alcohol dehydrogenase family)